MESFLKIYICTCFISEYEYFFDILIYIVITNVHVFIHLHVLLKFIHIRKKSFKLDLTINICMHFIFTIHKLYPYQLILVQFTIFFSISDCLTPKITTEGATMWGPCITTQGRLFRLSGK